MQIRPFQPADEAAVIALWEECKLTRPWNDPRKDIARKLAMQPELFLVGVEDGVLMASAMLNLQVRNTNPDAIAFYRRLGYAQDESVSLAKRLISDEVG